MGVIFHKKKKYGGTGVKVQSDASATSLNPLDVPNGQTIESVLNSKIVKDYGTVASGISSGYECPSDGEVVVSYGASETGYCYVKISNSPQFFTSKANSNGGLSFAYRAFKGNQVTYQKTGGTVSFIPYTY